VDQRAHGAIGKQNLLVQAVNEWMCQGKRLLAKTRLVSLTSVAMGIACMMQFE
jgi:hypothetical protein